MYLFKIKHLLLLLAAVMVSCGVNNNANAERVHELSKHFVVKDVEASIMRQAHLELYVREKDGQLTLIGMTRDPMWAEKAPFGFKGLQAKSFAISDDGKSLVYAHSFGSQEEKPLGVYYRRFDQPEKLVLEGVPGATNYGKPLPPNIVALGHKGVTTEGNIVDLVLIGGSSLHEAAFMGDATRIDTLVKSGADLHASNYWGHEPLELAIVGRHNEAAASLISHGASAGPNASIFLYLAANYKLPKTVDLLLQHGADPNSPGPEGFTPLHAAVLYPGAYVSHNLIMGGPRRDDFAEIFPRAIDVLNILLTYGANPNALSNNGKRPLNSIMERYWWDQRDHPEIKNEFRRLLIEAGAQTGIGKRESENNKH